MEKQTKLGIIGIGHWGTNFANTINNMDHVSITAACTSNPEKHGLMGSECFISTDWNTVLNQPIDGLIVTSPPQNHRIVFQECLNKKLPVIMEKPVTLDLKEMEDLHQQHSLSNSTVLVDYTMLFNASFLELKKQLHRVGKVKSIHSSIQNKGPIQDYSALWNYCPHDLAMIDYITGNLPLIKSFSGPKDNGFDGCFQFSGHADDIFCSIDSGNGYDNKCRQFIVKGEKGTLFFDDLLDEKLTYKSLDDHSEIIPVEDKRFPLDIVVDTFITHIEKGNDPRFGLDLSLEITQWLTAADQLLHH